MSSAVPGSTVVRAGGLADIDAVMIVMGEAFDPCFGEAWSRAQCLGILGLPDVWLSIADTCDGEGGCAGFTLSRIVLDEAELLLLAVRPAARQRGLGLALVDRVAADAASRGARRLMLEMRDGNPAAGVYARTGFVQIGRRRAYYRGTSGETRDALTLARDLAPI